MKNIKLIQGDCLEVMKDIPDGSIDMILTDPPYGTISCSWDLVIPFKPMWKQLHRIIKKHGAIVLFGSEPFSSYLRLSNIKNFRYDWIWEKTTPGNISFVKRMPLKYHEIISVFYKKQCCYNRQMIKRNELGRKRLQNKKNPIRFVGSNIQGTKHIKRDYDINKYDSFVKNPSSILKFKKQRGCFHPTQKPVKLLEYLIKTYTNKGETVLDFTMGSGSTIIAALNTDRKAIGIELDENYFKIAQKRIKDHLGLFAD